MSTLAAITVKDCNDCGEVAVLSSDEDYGSFEAHWYDGNAVHFCPECKWKPENQQAIYDDQQLTEDIKLAIKQSTAYRESLDNGGANVERSH